MLIESCSLMTGQVGCRRVCPLVRDSFRQIGSRMAISWRSIEVRGSMTGTCLGKERMHGRVEASGPDLSGLLVTGTITPTYRSGSVSFSLINNVEALCSDGRNDVSPFVLLVRIGIVPRRLVIVVPGQGSATHRVKYWGGNRAWFGRAQICKK